MRRGVIVTALLLVLMVGCGKKRPVDLDHSGTLAELQQIEPDLQELEVEEGLEQAMEHYRRFLEEAPDAEMTPEAMRRLADLQIEKQFGVTEAARVEDKSTESNIADLARPSNESAKFIAPQHAQVNSNSGNSAKVNSSNPVLQESASDFEARTTETSASFGQESDDGWKTNELAHGEDPSGPLEAIALYDELLSKFPNYEHRDQVLYQKARAYDELGRTEEAIATMEKLIEGNAHSDHLDEVQFRRGEYFFTRRKYREAEDAYGAVIALGNHSTFYERALYKLGWAFYKQDLYEEALHRYMALLDHKVSIGYDFDAENSEEDERRIADTFRVISFSLNNLGGPKAVTDYFARFGHRDYESLVYNNLGDHYLEKLRYDDAAATYRAFVSLYPLHQKAPHFSMRVIETFTAGEFPILVLEAKREFASQYGLQANYWHHFDPEQSPEVIAYLKSNLQDLANHYHAEFQFEEDDEPKQVAYQEAQRWYGDYLDSFPEDSDTPPIHYRLADLHLEAEDFLAAAQQYERTAYEYELHEQSAAAGYAAVYAYRQQLEKLGSESSTQDLKRQTVTSSIQFADTFPEHEQVAAVLVAAADDLYDMSDYPMAVASAQRVIDDYKEAEEGLHRSAWIVVAHGSFELTDFARAEDAYSHVLSVTADDDELYAAFVDNLAASIYKQGEIANNAEDFRAAADHFLRIRTAAPTSEIRAAAEYDAGAALMRLEDWSSAATVLNDFRNTFPEHNLRLDATRQIATAYRENGELHRSAEEYEKISLESEDSVMRSDALLMAGELYEECNAEDQALAVYTRFAGEFPDPVEPALEARSKVAEIYKGRNETDLYHEQLAEIVRIDREAGPQRSSRTRTLGGRSALVLAEQRFDSFTEIKLTQPFEESLLEKQERMSQTITAMEELVDYEISEITAAATFYMAETYRDFSQSLAESERPQDLSPTDLMDYELALEEELFPFEEKAIDLHESNLALLHAGILNSWTERSLGQLIELVPGRYAKQELNAGLDGAIDFYDYRYPGCSVPEPSTEGASEPSLDGESDEVGQLQDKPTNNKSSSELVNSGAES